MRLSIALPILALALFPAAHAATLGQTVADAKTGEPGYDPVQDGVGAGVNARPFGWGPHCAWDVTIGPEDRARRLTLVTTTPCEAIDVLEEKGRDQVFGQRAQAIPLEIAGTFSASPSECRVVHPGTDSARIEGEFVRIHQLGAAQGPSQERQAPEPLCDAIQGAAPVEDEEPRDVAIGASGNARSPGRDDEGSLVGPSAAIGRVTVASGEVSFEVGGQSSPARPAEYAGLAPDPAAGGTRLGPPEGRSGAAKGAGGFAGPSSDLDSARSRPAGERRPSQSATAAGEPGLKAAGTFGLVLGLIAALGSLALYARKVGERALDHPVRSGIVARLSERPGLTVTALARDLSIDASLAKYHLRYLMRAGLVVAHGAARGQRYALDGVRVDVRAADALASDTARRIRAEVEAEPGLTMVDLCRRTAISGPLVAHHLKSLAEAGLVRREKTAGRSRLWPGA